MSVLATVGICLLVLGVIFNIIEAFIPGFGFFGITGVVSFVAGIVLFIIDGASALTVFLLILGLAVLLTFIVLFIMESSKHGLISKSAISETATAIPKDYADEKKNPYRVLLYKEGVISRGCRPVGKAVFSGVEQEVISLESTIEIGKKVKVFEVQGNKIFVREI